jgi:hypothetical protein
MFIDDKLPDEVVRKRYSDRCYYSVFAPCRLNFLPVLLAAEVVSDGDDRGNSILEQGGLT